MRKSSWTPSIVPDGRDQNVYLVADDSADWVAFGLKPASTGPIWKGSFKTS